MRLVYRASRLQFQKHGLIYKYVCPKIPYLMTAEPDRDHHLSPYPQPRRRNRYCHSRFIDGLQESRPKLIIDIIEDLNYSFSQLSMLKIHH